MALRYGAATEDEVRATKPTYCPNCASSLALEGSGTYPVGPLDQVSGHDWSFPVLWDTYCKACDWGGDINPIVVAEAEEG